MTQEPDRVVQAVYVAINSGDASVFDLLDPGIAWVTPATLPWTPPGSDGCYEGHDAVARYFGHCLEQVDELRIDVSDLFVRDERVVRLEGFPDTAAMAAAFTEPN